MFSYKQVKYKIWSRIRLNNTITKHICRTADCLFRHIIQRVIFFIACSSGSVGQYCLEVRPTLRMLCLENFAILFVYSETSLLELVTAIKSLCYVAGNGERER
jgi:hypothetical protein